MSGKLPGQIKLEQGLSTIELMLAFALSVTVIGTVAVAVQNVQLINLDSLTNTEAITKAQSLLEESRVIARGDYDSVVTTPITQSAPNDYRLQTWVDPASVTQCGKDVVAKVLWDGSSGRNLSVEFRTHLTDYFTALALSHCAEVPPLGTWTLPIMFASDSITPAKPTAIEVLNGIIYITANEPPYFFIGNKSLVTLGQTSGLFINFANGFNALNQLNDIKVAKLSNGRTYAFIARHTITDQFQVIDVTDIYNPVEVVRRTLTGVNQLGSFPQGWRVYYYSGRVYVVTRETTGPELHVFDVSNSFAFPASITELGSRELNDTVESMVAVKQGSQVYLYMASDSAGRELDVWDVTNPSSMFRVTTAVQDLPGSQDGACVFALNGLLYFGRASNSGSELYIFDAHNPQVGLQILQQKDIGATVSGISVAGGLVFLSTPKVGSEFQVWSADSAKPITQINISGFSYAGIISNGIVYEQPYVYVVSQGVDSLKLLYSQ